MEKELLVSVSIKDCEVQTFRSGGKGGQNQNKRDTGVRVIHSPSGARGESREERSQLANKRRAFRRMGESREFKRWIAKLDNRELPEASSSERIRTYNLVDNYVKDHRTGDQTKSVSDVLDGDIDSIYKPR